ncbi:MAG: hypothetical protein QJR00_01970 [Bacillota bacterium]|nr:hypothetical protein [Bacillota bacterium]
MKGRLNDVPCSIPPELLSAYLDDEVSSEERVRVELALASEPGCARQLEAWRQMQDALRHLPLPPLPPHFQASLRDRLFRYAPLVAARNHPRREPARGWRVLTVAAALLLVVLGGAGGAALVLSVFHPLPQEGALAEGPAMSGDGGPVALETPPPGEESPGDSFPMQALQEESPDSASRAASSQTLPLRGVGEVPVLLPTDPPRYQRQAWLTVTTADLESSLAGALKVVARYGARLTEGKAPDAEGARLRLQISSALVDDLLASLADEGQLRELKVEAIPLDAELRSTERAWKELEEAGSPDASLREKLDLKRVELWQAAQWAEVDITFLPDR